MGYYHLVKRVAQRQSQSGCHSIGFHTLMYHLHTSDVFIITFNPVIPVELHGNMFCQSRVGSNVYVICVSVESPSQQLTIYEKVDSTVQNIFSIRQQLRQ